LDGLFFVDTDVIVALENVAIFFDLMAELTDA
jgi:hypothetical protein